MPRLALFLMLLASGSADAAFFLDAAGLADWLKDYEAYQEKREIRYMAKASQYVGYVTGVVDSLDGSRFCLPGQAGAEPVAALVAAYVREHPVALPRHGADIVATALVERYPCRP